MLVAAILLAGAVVLAVLGAVGLIAIDAALFAAVLLVVMAVVFAIGARRL